MSFRPAGPDRAASFTLLTALLTAIDEVFNFVDAYQLRLGPVYSTNRWDELRFKDFERLDLQVFRLAHKAGLGYALPQRAVIIHEAKGDGLDDPPLPEPSVAGNTYLPGDWFPDPAGRHFHPVFNAGWRKGMDTLRDIVSLDLTEIADVSADPQSGLPTTGTKYQSDSQVPPEFREGNKRDGAVLTAKYLRESTNWGLKGPYISGNYGPGKILTTRVKVGRAEAYLFKQLLHLRDKFSQYDRVKSDREDR